MHRSSLIVLAALVACGDDDGGTDAGVNRDSGGGMDSGTDAGTRERIEDLPIETEIDLPGLTGPVEVVQDDRGMWHVYTAELGDALRVQGYLMARDRYGQMEFIRSSAKGELALLAGALSPDLVNDDIDARFTGFRRQAAALADALSADDRALIEAFTGGINTFIGELRDGTTRLPMGVRNILDVAKIRDWGAIDVLAIARLQSAQLSYDVGEDTGFTRTFAAWAAAFPPGDPDARLAARADAFHDLFSFLPSEPAFSRDGFPNVDTDTGTRALIPPRRVPRERIALPPMEALRGADAFGRRMEARLQSMFGDETRGSNSWVVHGDHTESGNPLLANDPHLQLSSPPLFWYVHINTKRFGGNIDVEGLSLAGTPVVLLGFNDRVAWGLTTHGFDVTDVYSETITEGGPGEPDTVLFDGMQVPIEEEVETIVLGDGSTMEVTFERVPHHGLIIPDSRTPTAGISVKWTGDDVVVVGGEPLAPSNELAAFRAMASAQNIDEVRAAYEAFGVGGQNLVAIGAENSIFWSTQVRLPIRDARALTYDPRTRMGVAPCFVLPGTGEYEWEALLSDRYLPHDLDPTAGFIATANNDGVGTIADGNPFNDPFYIGWSFSEGHRQARILERLAQATTAGPVNADVMSDIQAEVQSPIGRRATTALVAVLDRAVAEAATPGTHPDLSELVASIGAARMAQIAMMRDRLEAWGEGESPYDTPAAVEGTPSPEEINDSIATTIFNAAIGRVLHGIFDDEIAALGDGTNRPQMKALLRILNDPTSLESFDVTILDTVFWDDLRTEETVETRGRIVLAAFADALAWLTADAPEGAGLGTDMQMWRWGRLHTLRFNSIIPQLGVDFLSIPSPTDPLFPNGFPRHGDNDVVDASGYGYYDTTDFRYTSGPQQRLVVEMTPTGPIARNALPGGQVQDGMSPHHRDEAELWRHNEAPPLYFQEIDVVTHAERRVRFTAP
jgi:penicillin amidase